MNAASPLTSDATDALEVDGLIKRYGQRTVVDEVSFTVGRGETYGLLGPNGAGKTTIISIICGLLSADGGHVAIAGHILDSRHVEVKASIGLVPQDIALYPDLTATENLAFFGRLQGLKGRRLAARVREVLDIIGLADRADERIENYSGGMKRRCNIGAGLLHEPELLILDEPTVGVDPQSRNAILDSLELLGGRGLSVLYTTHYMEEAERLCDRIGIIDEGRLVAEGTRAQLVEQVGEHAHVSVAASGDLQAFAVGCTTLAGVDRATTSEGGIELLVADPSRILAPVVEMAERNGVHVVAVEVSQPDLETVFLRLTGKALRD